MNYDDTRFFSMLKKFGRRRLITAPDFIFALVLATSLAVMSGYFLISKEAIQSLSPVLIPVGAALVAIIITGLAIIVSTSDDNFIKILKDAGIYENILFPFWYTSMVSGICIVFVVISYISILIIKPEFTINILGYILLSNNIFTFLLWLSFLSTFYALFSVIALKENVVKYGLYRGAFIESRRKKERELLDKVNLK